VDQPPFAPLLTRITGVLGVSPTAIRIIPALAGGAIVVIAARLVSSRPSPQVPAPDCHSAP